MYFNFHFSIFFCQLHSFWDGSFIIEQVGLFLNRSATQFGKKQSPQKLITILQANPMHNLILLSFAAIGCYCIIQFFFRIEWIVICVCVCARKKSIVCRCNAMLWKYLATTRITLLNGVRNLLCNHVTRYCYLP